MLLTLKHYETVSVFKFVEIWSSDEKKDVKTYKFVEILGGAGYWTSMAGSVDWGGGEEGSEDFTPCCFKLIK